MISERVALDLSPEAEEIAKMKAEWEEKKKKTRTWGVCFKFLDGECPRGEKCKFTHDKSLPDPRKDKKKQVQFDDDKSPRREERELRCYDCGRKGHRKGDQECKGTLCYNCGAISKGGHTSRDCPESSNNDEKERIRAMDAAEKAAEAREEDM